MKHWLLQWLHKFIKQPGTKFSTKDNLKNVLVFFKQREVNGT